MLAVASSPWAMFLFSFLFSYLFIFILGYVSSIYNCLHSGLGLPIGRKLEHLQGYVQLHPSSAVYMLFLLNDLRHFYLSYIQVVLGLNNQSAEINGKKSPCADARLNLCYTCYWLILSSKQPCGMGRDKYEYYYFFIAYQTWHSVQCW